MNPIYIFISVGILGGLARSSYGLLKALTAGLPISKGYFLITLLVAAAIGGLLGFVFNIDLQIAALAGYVGTDILENIFKGTLGGKNITLGKK